RAVMSEVAGRIRGLEAVGAFGDKAVPLAEGQTFAHDSDFYKKTLAQYAAITPAVVRTTMQQWLRRPALTIMPSPRERSAPPQSAENGEAKPASDKGERLAVKPTRQIPPLGQLTA